MALSTAERAELCWKLQFLSRRVAGFASGVNSQSRSIHPLSPRMNPPQAFFGCSQSHQTEKTHGGFLHLVHFLAILQCTLWRQGLHHTWPKKNCLKGTKENNAFISVSCRDITFPIKSFLFKKKRMKERKRMYKGKTHHYYITWSKKEHSTWYYFLFH